MSKIARRDHDSQAPRATAPPASKPARPGVHERQSSASEPESLDRRVRRTQRALREALIQLVKERGWDAVSVRAVCARADVGRSTFYLHFADKEELLVSGFADLRAALRQHAAKANGESLAFTSALMEHAREYYPLLKPLVGRKTGLAVQRGFMDVVKDLVTDDLRKGPQLSPAQQIAVSYIAGALWELLHWWLEQRRPPPAVELAAHFRRLTLPVMRAARE